VTFEIFNCRKCGDCCKGYGGTFVTRADIEAIADYIDSDPETFVDEYCVLSGSKPVLKQAETGYCIFWDGLCTIHPVKPRMCEAWPFLRCVLTDINNWRIMSNSCPGIQTDVSDSRIKERIRAVLAE
jgi:uncharacterized protein